MKGWELVKRLWPLWILVLAFGGVTGLLVHYLATHHGGA